MADNNPDWVHGVRVDKCGAPLGYAVHARRRGGNFEFERMVDARNLYLHGYYTRFDQIRGVGLLASAGNAFKDVSEWPETHCRPFRAEKDISYNIRSCRLFGE